MARAMPVAPVPVPQPVEPPSSAGEPLCVEQELQVWKDARGSNFKIPWRQIYLMASLCFGIASFALPDSVNDSIDYLLWGLMAMSAYAWYTTRKKKPVKDTAVP